MRGIDTNVLVRYVAGDDARQTAVVERLMEQSSEAGQSFHVENDPLVRRSLDASRYGTGDFADYVIGEMCLAAACEDCITFDRGLKGAAGFTLLR